MRTTLLATAAALALMAPGAASAALVTFTSLSAAWQNDVPDAGVTINNASSTAPTVRWGTPSGQPNQSGYNYVTAGVPINVNVNPPPQTPDFSIGTFTHLNFPITGVSLDSIQLRITANISVDNVAIGSRAFVFDLTHDETTNNLNPCPYGGANGQGVNINGCADRVTVSFNDTSESFNVGGVDYTLNIFGFSVGGNSVTQFLTIENQSNGAQLLANVAARATLVPEPASLALLGMGLLGLGYTRRRRKAA